MVKLNINHEQGRSMVEMLGVLAIVGVLSVGAIGGYSYAMNKHRTNELIYEATKRAQWVGTQLEMNNPNPSLNTFGTDSFGGGSFDAVLVNLPNNQIGIVVKDLKEAVCENIKNEIGDNTVLRAIKDSTGTGDVTCEDNGTAALIFNRDLGTTDTPVGGNETGNGQNEEPPQPLDCGEHGEQVGNACECEDGWGGDACEIESTDPTTYENQPCDDNDDCGSYGTYFCQYTSVNCTTGHTAKGRCTKTSSIRGSGDGYVWSTTHLDWFSAENFCAANGKEMISFDDLDCSYTLAQYKSNEWGFCCVDDSNSIDSVCGESAPETVTADGSVNSDLSSEIQVIQAAGAPPEYYWTKTLTDNSCRVFSVHLSSGYVFFNGRSDGFSALCR